MRRASRTQAGGGLQSGVLAASGDEVRPDHLTTPTQEPQKSRNIVQFSFASTLAARFAPDPRRRNEGVEPTRRAVVTDALWVGTSRDGVEGPAGRLKATSATVTRLRTGLGSRSHTMCGRFNLKASVEVGLRQWLRQDGGDAETGARAGTLAGRCGNRAHAAASTGRGERQRRDGTQLDDSRRRFSIRWPRAPRNAMRFSLCSRGVRGSAIDREPASGRRSGDPAGAPGAAAGRTVAKREYVAAAR